MITAASVSARLRRYGVNPLGSGSSRGREGVRVSRTVFPGRVCVTADFDFETPAARMIDAIVERLELDGFTVERANVRTCYVTRTEATP